MKQLQEYDYKILEEYWRKYPKIIQLVDKEPSPLKRQNMMDVLKAIESIFNGASEDMKKIAHLYFWEGYSIAMVAEEVLMPISKVRRIMRALLKETSMKISWV